MSDFDRIKFYYDKDWTTKSQLKKYVDFGKITPEEYEIITGDMYVA